ncbi:MAG: hypothetical protein KDK76_01760 [Chlamydiia bacterium]|nr:hypothetical protein [Chlamydiia bacterium]
MPLDLPLLHHHLEQARTFARSFTRGDKVPFTPQTVWDKHFERALHYLETKEARLLIKRFTLPIVSRYVETLVRKSLKIPKNQMLEDRHLQEGVISALLCPLRQVVGSCFATAPAIFIQREQPERLLLDLYDLMTLGYLKRTFGGQEFVVPISPKWGNRESDHPLLRAWEYTLASFADYKTTFSRWNLYQSLGLDPEKKGGIGALIYQKLQEKLDETNQKVEKFHQDYVRAMDEARVSQALLRQADSPDRMRMRKGELEVRAHHAHGCKEERDKMHEKGQGLSQLFSFLIEQYTAKFQEYFIEIYDADIKHQHEILYEDSPAGFRLCYKHGRSDPSAWTYIYEKEEFLNVLREFFLAVEPQICSACEWEEGIKEIEELTTTIVHFIQTEEFSSFALKKKNPWSYTSGGDMHTLLKGYYCIEGELSEEKRVIENPTDLLTFLLDLLKELPYFVTKPFEIDPLASLLMYSPTHAFLLKPGLSPFKEGWLDKGFTYTWIRDCVINPATNYYKGIRLDKSAQSLLASKVMGGKFYPREESLSVPEFRAHLVEAFPKKEEEIDGILFQSFKTPKPLLFADTNWADYFFAFAVNPATLQLDLYRVSSDGSRGYPMNPWRSYLDGTTSSPWGVLTRPTDLTGASLSDISLKLSRV